MPRPDAGAHEVGFALLLDLRYGRLAVHGCGLGVLGGARDEGTRSSLHAP